VKYLPLIWSDVWRKPGRTALIFLQVMIAFALFGVLQGLRTGTETAIANTRADVLSVRAAVRGGAALPRAVLEHLRDVPGVRYVTFVDTLQGTYQKPNQSVSVLAIDADPVWLTMMPEMMKVQKKDLDALRGSRTGVLVDPAMAKKFGWRVGDKIPLTSATLQSNGSGNWTFDIVGNFVLSGQGPPSSIVANYAYLDEGRAQNKGTVRNFFVSISDPHQAAAISATIDHRFANSSNGTKTASLHELAQQGLQSLGDVDFLIHSIISAVLVALLFAVSTMLTQTIRERIPELAVLKTVGFSNGALFTLVVVEVCLICVVAALVGLAVAVALFPLAANVAPGLSMPLSVIGVGVIGACLVGMASAAIPAMRAAQLPIVDALAGR
jgi:putative ABC transport system permease protein